jgi:hypothetical protein
MVLTQIGGIVANLSFLLLNKQFVGANQQLGAQRTVMLFAAINATL